LVTRAGVAPELVLPPLYQPVRLREFGDAFSHAAALAPKHGAGTLVYVGRFDLAEFALVLEPSEPLANARRVFYAGMAALADALAATAPPETAIHIEWPDAVYVNWGLVGGGRLAWPKQSSESAVPDWLVFAATIRTAWPKHVDPGLMPDVTALDEEGFAEVTSHQIIESFARNFMQAIDAWQESGFASAVKSYLERLARESGACEIDEHGDLLLRPVTGGIGQRKNLVPRLAAPAWLEMTDKGQP
jgi:biotin-(acetyl-CoA carboxylase) ligase